MVPWLSGRAFASHAKGRRFESFRNHNKKGIRNILIWFFGICINDPCVGDGICSKNSEEDMVTDTVRWNEIHKKIPQDLARHSQYAEHCERIFPGASTVCDLAGGLGYDAMYFIGKGHNVIILDISDYALKQALQLAKDNKVSKKLVVRKADFSSGAIPLKNKSIDIVFSRIGFNYFPYEETRALLAEAYRILKIDGKAYIAFKSPEDEDDYNFLKKNTVEMEKNVFIEGEQIRSRFTKEQLEQMLIDIGISDYSVNSFVEERETIRDEFMKASKKVLYLNEVQFKKI
jgi:ubiquinone/menaquinone biosynthesis C-methylase UbiE